MYLIFDFDGTLIDSFQCALEKFSLLAEQEQFRKPELKDLAKLKNLTSKELIRHLEIPIYKLPKVIYEARKRMNEDILSLSSFGALAETLQALVKAGYSLGIVTSNSLHNVNSWLKHNKLQQLFKFVHNEANYFGKARILKKIVKKYGLDKQFTFYIADETRDIEAAKRCGIQSIAVTWGFNSEQVLKQLQPNFIARTPSDLLTILQLS